MYWIVRNLKKLENKVHDFYMNSMQPSLSSNIIKIEFQEMYVQVREWRVKKMYHVYEETLFNFYFEIQFQCLIWVSALIIFQARLSIYNAIISTWTRIYIIKRNIYFTHKNPK